MLDRRNSDKVKADILSRITLAKPTPKRRKMRKKVKSGEIREYTVTEFFIRLSAKKGGLDKPLIILTADDFRELMAIKTVYELSDEEFSWVILDVMEMLQ